jgi:hypothetical protein
MSSALLSVCCAITLQYTGIPENNSRGYKKAFAPKGTKAERAPWYHPDSFGQQAKPHSPVTWGDGPGYIIHRNSSEASSSSALTGSHHPPALWKARNDYYSSSQPFQVVQPF